MPPRDLCQHVSDFLTRHVTPGAPFLIALSGGVDSMVLLDIAARLNRENSLNTAPLLVFRAMHVNHGMSKNADAWAQFCHAQCAARDVALSVTRVEIDRHAGTGLEAAAREARYRALGQTPARFVLTAQHQDDQAETVLHQLLRGTGLAGLAGMGESRVLATGQVLLRPLLTISRAAIEIYAREHHLTWIEDESNQDTAYTRNFIRHDVLPNIAARFPHYAESLTRAARHAHESASLNEALAKLDLKWDGVEAYADALDTLPRERQTNALYYWLRWQDLGDLSAPSQQQIEEWATQIFRPSPKGKPHLAGGHGVKIRRVKNRLVLET